ncbi:hypothetical protein TCAL_16121 [Tigriopus californicus]|uniref:Uncharacterized protein n=1 Tax=Tigriopus californicus TaxID=6832 RepID=A0A553PN90_TIGCA|nr:uncharacterized protein LOC131882643 [Tigriopus californicus]TRY79155.1 hypothetical protein TCAL_16121 [Tigriopus californicus]
MPIFRLRRKAPSVSDSLAVVGLRKALLVGMLSNLGEEDDGEDDVDAKSESSCLADESSLGPSDKETQGPELEDPDIDNISKGVAGIYTDSSNTVTTSSSSFQSPSLKKTRRARSIVRQQSRVSAEFQNFDQARQSSSDDSTEASGTRSRANLRRARSTSSQRSIPVPVVERQKCLTNDGQDSSVECSSPDSSFATLMFARDAPKISAKDLLKIPLTAPSEIGTPPPPARYTNASGLGLEKQKRKRFIQKSRMSYSMDHQLMPRHREPSLMSLNDTFQDTDSEPGRLLLPSPKGPRRTSFAPPKALGLAEKELLERRRKSDLPLHPHFRRSSNVTFAPQTKLSDHGRNSKFEKAASFHTAEDPHVHHMNSDWSTSLPMVIKSNPRQPFRSVYSNRLTVPDPYGYAEVTRVVERPNRFLKRQHSFDRGNEIQSGGRGTLCHECANSVDRGLDQAQQQEYRPGILKQPTQSCDGQINQTGHVKVTAL